MHEGILDTNQKDILKIVRYFTSKNFYLVGGTALALQIGHRESIDFDLFTDREFDHNRIIDKLQELLITGYMKKPPPISTLATSENELTLLVNKVKITFYKYPFKVPTYKTSMDIVMTDEITIGAMKAYALGRRSKWKDYVDLYYILQRYSLQEVSKHASRIYKKLFSEKLFRTQLCYFEGIDYTEKVIWKDENHPTKKGIKDFLVEVATNI